MTSPIELQRLDLKPTDTRERERKQPSTYNPKKKQKKTLTKELEDGTLSALKSVLNQQKMVSQRLDVEASDAKIGKLEPSAQVTQLYSKLADTLVHMHKNGIAETTITLGEAFKSSVFNGAKITITEFSTAPKIFNIRFSASPEAVSFFQTHAADLTNALNHGKFKFGVHHVDTSITTDEKTPLIEEVTEKEEDEE